MNDYEIEHLAEKLNIKKVVQKLGLSEEDIILYGNDKAKIIKKPNTKKAKLILVTAINPTPYGEGKTTVSIGLHDALCKLNKKSILTLREPSMGPVFGMKGGATGGGYAQITPSSSINLHFTGDLHAITSANNLLAAAIDNHIKNGNELKIKEVLFERAIDVNDRALRNVIIEQREEHFNITAASEIMSIFCLASDLNDLKQRLGNIIIGINDNEEYIYAKYLKIEGALTALLKDAFYPNVVQTLENNPVFVHGGPFANISFGCNSLNSTNLALSLADYVVTEAGFGADLGAEKFFDIKCRIGKIKPECIVLVTTVRALKYHGENNISKGIKNLTTHIENLKKNNTNIVVALNKFKDDSEDDIKLIEEVCKKELVSFSVTNAYDNGGDGSIDLAKKVLIEMENENKFHYLYEENKPIKEKIEILAKEIYRASGITYSEKSKEMIKKLEETNLSNLPICVSKTQYSLSDDKNNLMLEEEYNINVSDIKLYSGAEFILVLLNKVITMPGLPKHPNYEKIDLDAKNNIIGII